MAWTSPLTFSAGATLTAAQLNTHLRDNLNETAAAKATTAGRIFVATGSNAIAERAIESATVATNEPQVATSYGDIATVGPSVTLTTGTRALVLVTAQMHNGTADTDCRAGFAVSGASTVAASDTTALRSTSATTFDAYRSTAITHQTGLTAGSNTFKMQYCVSAGTGQIQNRHLIVIGL